MPRLRSEHVVAVIAGKPFRRLRARYAARREDLVLHPDKLERTAAPSRRLLDNIIEAGRVSITELHARGVRAIACNQAAYLARCQAVFPGQPLYLAVVNLRTRSLVLMNATAVHFAYL